MTLIRKWMRALGRDERGLTTVEYLIVLCLLAAGAVGTWRTLGATVTNTVTKANTQLTGLLPE